MRQTSIQQMQVATLATLAAAKEAKKQSKVESSSLEIDKDYIKTLELAQAQESDEEIMSRLADRFEIKLHYGYDRSVESKYIKSESLLDLAYGMRSTSVGVAESSSDNSTIFETPITSRMLKTFEKISTELSFDLACDIFANNFTPEERSSVRMLLESASYNIKEDLGIEQENIVTNQDEDQA